MGTYDQHADFGAPLPDCFKQIEGRSVWLNIADDDELQRRLGLDRGQHRRRGPDSDLRLMVTEQTLQRCVQLTIVRGNENPRVGLGRNHLARMIGSYTPYAATGDAPWESDKAA